MTLEHGAQPQKVEPSRSAGRPSEPGSGETPGTGSGPNHEARVADPCLSEQSLSAQLESPVPVARPTLATPVPPTIPAP
eukprot:8348039-Pyramimonas_sp.AAC.1